MRLLKSSSITPEAEPILIAFHSQAWIISTLSGDVINDSLSPTPSNQFLCYPDRPATHWHNVRTEWRISIIIFCLPLSAAVSFQECTASPLINSTVSESLSATPRYLETMMVLLRLSPCEHISPSLMRTAEVFM